MSRIVITLMIKNESAIIERCIRSTLDVADAICICDTGSTDNTLQVIDSLKTTLVSEGFDLPIRVYNHIWENFGHNRTLSFQSAVDMAATLGWDLSKTYALLIDADMKLVNRSLDKSTLTEDGYLLIQINGSIEYHNTRFAKLSAKWTCVGYTHEYWNLDGPGKNEPISQDIIFIDDRGDGGCKADKFERDKRLLLDELEAKPGNVRSLFYLAQTYWCLGDKENAIKYYKLRVDAGGWWEEVFYSMYMISKAYLALDNPIKGEYWALKAYDRFKGRAEAIYNLAKYFRLKSEHYKSYHYIKLGEKIKKPDDRLFVETAVYNHLFKYEESIIDYYVGRRKEGMYCTLDYLRNFDDNWNNVYINMEHYMNNFRETFPFLEIRRGDLHSKPTGDFHASSCSLIEHNGLLIGNIRYVNYDITANGSYLMYENGIKSSNHTVRTENKRVFFDSELNILRENMMETEGLRTYYSNIQGLEDVRIFKNNGQLEYFASSKDVSNDNKIKIVHGNYDYINSKFTNNKVIESPMNLDCEKNWVMLGENELVYNWYPFTIGELKDGKIHIKEIQETRGIFKNMRGSTGFVDVDGKRIGIVHGVYYNTPRKYYHMFVEIAKKDNEWNIVRHSVPFYFDNLKIEYCIGMAVSGGSCYVVYSRNDNNPAWIRFNSLDLERVLTISI